MDDSGAFAFPRTIIRKGIGLETPNYGSSCKGYLLYCFLFFAFLFWSPMKNVLMRVTYHGLCRHDLLKCNIILSLYSKTENIFSR